MKKIIAFFLIVLLGTSCEPEDICVEAPTPKLVIQFKDLDTDEELKLSSCRIFLNSLTSPTDTIDASNTNMISVPLTSDLTTEELHIFIKKNNSSAYDPLRLNYVPDIEFTSKACGGILIYTQFIAVPNGTLTDIQNILTETTIINNELNPHLTLYY